MTVVTFWPFISATSDIVSFERAAAFMSSSMNQFQVLGVGDIQFDRGKLQLEIKLTTQPYEEFPLTLDPSPCVSTLNSGSPFPRYKARDTLGLLSVVNRVKILVYQFLVVSVTPR
jgi:hypothetical protein